MTTFNMPFANPWVQDINHIVSGEFHDTWTYTLETGPQFFFKYNFDAYFLSELHLTINDTVTVDCPCAGQFVLDIPSGNYQLDISGVGSIAGLSGYNGDFLAVPINPVPGPIAGAGLPVLALALFAASVVKYCRG